MLPLGGGVVPDFWNRLRQGARAQGGGAAAPRGGGQGQPSAAVPAPAAPGENRVLAALDLAGRQYCDWRGLIGRMFPVTIRDFGHWFKGPSITGDLMRKWERLGGVLTQVREFLRIQNVPEESAHAHEMKVLGMAIELATTVDQVNPEGCYFLELLARRLSLLQHAYESCSKGGAPDFTCADVWLGCEGMEQGQASQMSEQKVYVAKEMERQASITKEVRKAKEEQRLASEREE